MPIGRNIWKGSANISFRTFWVGKISKSDDRYLKTKQNKNKPLGWELSLGFVVEEDYHPNKKMKRKIKKSREREKEREKWKIKMKPKHKETLVEILEKMGRDGNENVRT